MILEAILLINPDAKACVYGNDIETCTIDWLHGTTAISKEVEVNIALRKLRRKRNILLEDTDFYALADVTMSDSMKTYRQSLRDITKGLTTVDQIKAIKFPTKP